MALQDDLDRRTGAGIQSRSSMGPPMRQYPPLPSIIPPPRSEMGPRPDGYVAPRRTSMLQPQGPAPVSPSRSAMGQRPTPAAPAGPTNFSGPGIPQSQALTGLPLLTQGVTQPAQTPAPAQPARLTPEQQVANISAGPPGLVAGPPVYSTGNAQGGTMTSSRGVQSVPSDYGAGRTNTFNTMASLPTYQSASPRNDMPRNDMPRNDMPRNYAPDATAARSRALDASVTDLMKRVQQPLMSYGDLFQRRGALAALQAISGLAQGAGTNAVTAAGQQLDASTRMRGQDINERLGVRRDATARRGQDLNYDATMSGQNVQREGNLLSQGYANARARLQAETQRYGYDTQAETQRFATGESTYNRMAALAANQMPQYQNMYLSGRYGDGTPIPQDIHKQIGERLNFLRQSASPFEQWLASQGPAVRTGR